MSSDAWPMIAGVGAATAAAAAVGQMIVAACTLGQQNSSQSGTDKEIRDILQRLRAMQTRLDEFEKDNGREGVRGRAARAEMARFRDSYRGCDVQSLQRLERGLATKIDEITQERESDSNDNSNQQYTAPPPAYRRADPRHDHAYSSYARTEVVSRDPRRERYDESRPVASRSYAREWEEVDEMDTREDRANKRTEAVSRDPWREERYNEPRPVDSRSYPWEREEEDARDSRTDERRSSVRDNRPKDPFTSSVEAMGRSFIPGSGAFSRR